MFKHKSLEQKHKELQKELAFLKEEHALLEEEQKVKELMSHVHPSQKQVALKRIEAVIGKLRGTPEQRKERRQKLQKGFKTVVKALEENKKSKETRYERSSPFSKMERKGKKWFEE